MHVRGTVIVPEEYLSAVLKLCMSRRGKLLSQDCLDESRLYLAFDFPLSEIIFDFNDKLKTASSGFARLASPYSDDIDVPSFRYYMLLQLLLFSFEFVETGWQPAEITKVNS